MIESELLDRLLEHARKWGVIVDDTFETESSVIAFGSRGRDLFECQPVVLKVIKQESDEWRTGEILNAFDANGVARVYEHAPGAVLLERLKPGNSLAEMALNGGDEEATDILASTIQQMSMQISRSETKTSASHVTGTVSDLAKAFERYTATGDEQVPKQLVESAHRLYSSLCASQRESRLLHGDLQHYNVLFDSARGWLAVDPKGVVGEVEYEIGAILRNPVERPELFTDPVTIERRIKRFTEKLNLDFKRVLAWGFAQAVLSAIWDIEDGFSVDAMNPALQLANAIQPMMRGR
ncbi:MAG: aminoglycoside phosphotransferase family protein [bacterium]